MEFIGENKVPAKRLRDTCLDKERLQSLYYEVLYIIRQMYHEAKLVHGDLSEYNILFY